MMLATFNSNPCTTIISCYIPININDETDLITFYNELSSFIRSIPKHNVLIIGGDMNAQIGKDESNKFCLHNLSNRNREHLTQFSLENRLTWFNTKFQKREGKLWTYTYANNVKTQIDYILINKKWIISALNREAYSSFEGISSDYRIVTAKIRLSLHMNTAQTAKTTYYDWLLLNNRDISYEYTITIRNKFDTLQEISETLTPNNDDENFINAHMEAAAGCMPTKSKAKHGRH